MKILSYSLKDVESLRHWFKTQNLPESLTVYPSDYYPSLIDSVEYLLNIAETKKDYSFFAPYFQKLVNIKMALECQR